MATFQVQVEDLTGSIGDTTAISSWLQDGCKEVINFIPQTRLEEVASTTVFENTIDVEGKKVLGVLRKDAGNSSYLTPCRKVAPTKKGIIQDSSNMEYATTSDPAYWMDGDTLQVFPTSASTNDMSLVHISLDFSAVTYDDSSITNFPDEAEPAVVLYAARNGIQRLMNDVNVSLSALSISSTVPVAPTLSTVSYSDATNADATATAVGDITVGSVSKADISGDVPSYTKPTLSLSSVAISDLSISASAPSVPSIATVTYADASNQSAFAEDMSTVTFGTVPSEINVSGSAPTFTPPVLTVDTSQFETFLETDEDSELAQIQLGRLNNEISEYQARLSESQAQFNKENSIYQTEFQEAISKFQADQQKVLEQARIDLAKAQQDSQNATNVDIANKAKDQELNLQNAVNNMQEIINNNNSLLAKFQQELGLYQQNVNKEIAEYQQNTQKELTLYQARTSVELQQYQADIQNELNEFNKENVRYQANIAAEAQKHNSDLQKAITQAQIDAADAQQTAQQSTNVDLANKAADQALALQNSAQNMQAKIQDNNNIMAKYGAELQAYGANVSKEVQEYNANLQKDTAKYTWYGQQYQIIDAQYKEFLQSLQGQLNKQ
tara:strand:+ start:307 stop:2142 length:1836 start_codon:yes stop_codon:yes gene_type:complete